MDVRSFAHLDAASDMRHVLFDSFHFDHWQAMSWRGLQLWRNELLPQLDLRHVAVFEQALPSIDMHAGLAFPWILSSGYAYGATCHALAGGAPERRAAAAATTALLMLVLGLFDHLLDEYPDELADFSGLVDGPALAQWVAGQNLSKLACPREQVLAAGLADLYRLYFERCHTLIDGGSDALKGAWLAALQAMHKVEAESVERRISRVAPSAELIDHAEGPSRTAFRLLAITACLGESDHVLDKVLPFADDMARLTWLVDDAADLRRDLARDVWSGLALKLALAPEGDKAVREVMTVAGAEAKILLGRIVALADRYRWWEQDDFSLGEILHAHIWAWLGGAHVVNGLSSGEALAPCV